MTIKECVNCPGATDHSTAECPTLRGLLARMLADYENAGEISPADLSKAHALLTVQPQAAPDEAVAQWQSMSCGEGGRWFNIADSDAEQAKSDGFEVRALYTHPAPSQPSGRVELSRQFVDAVKQLCKDFSDLQNRPYMGDVYAALDGLLEHEQIPVAATPHPEQPQACAAQSAPAGERDSYWFSLLMNCAAELETSSYCMADTEAKRVAQSGADYYREQARASWQRAQSAPVAPEGERLADLLESVWMGDDEAKPHGIGATYWNNAVIACKVAIRDALAAAPAQPLLANPHPLAAAQGEFGDAYQGAREDLAIWKRRALEAEDSVRELEARIDTLILDCQGESRMGEPDIPTAQGQPEAQRLREDLAFLADYVWRNGCGLPLPNYLALGRFPVDVAKAALATSTGQEV